MPAQSWCCAPLSSSPSVVARDVLRLCGSLLLAHSCCCVVLLALVTPGVLQCEPTAQDRGRCPASATRCRPPCACWRGICGQDCRLYSALHASHEYHCLLLFHLHGGEDSELPTYWEQTPRLCDRCALWLTVDSAVSACLSVCLWDCPAARPLRLLNVGVYYLTVIRDRLRKLHTHPVMCLLHARADTSCCRSLHPGCTLLPRCAASFCKECVCTF